MCKYCEMKPNKDGWSEQIEQGSIKFNVELSRTEDGEAFICMDISAVLQGEPNNMYIIENKITKIRYCPFCGERLEKIE